jgi:hypothetical protein
MAKLIWGIPGEGSSVTWNRGIDVGFTGWETVNDSKVDVSAQFAMVFFSCVASFQKVVIELLTVL